MNYIKSIGYAAILHSLGGLTEGQKETFLESLKKRKPVIKKRQDH
ncbi:hypothetical protein [Alkalicoccobacillus plakortidis]|nr:hypothetical protein [Alkalicoccobacillus plakortidis]